MKLKIKISDLSEVKKIKKIEDCGIKVYTQYGYKKIIDFDVTEKNVIPMLVRTNNFFIIASKNHRLYSNNNWVNIDDLNLGDLILTKNGYEEAVQQLKNNYQNIQKFLNIIEDKLEFSLRTIIEEANDDRYLIKVPKEWTGSTIMISLYSLLTRAAILYDGEKDIIKYLTEYEYIVDDKYLIKSMIPRLEVILETKKLVPQPPFDEERAKKGQFSPHNLGILSWNMKYEEELEAHGVD